MRNATFTFLFTVLTSCADGNEVDSNSESDSHNGNDSDSQTALDAPDASDKSERPTTSTDETESIGSEVDTSAPDILPDDLVIETISADPSYIILEGPVWDQAGTLYFTDIDNNNVYRYQTDGTTTLFRTDSNGTNGLMFDLRGRLCCCEGDLGRITALDAGGSVVEVLAESYEGTRFNRPNDLVFDKLGGFYFTDPTWDAHPPQDKNGVYYRDATGLVTRLIDDMEKPNGILLNPAEDTLYVDDTDNKYVRAYDIVGPGVIDNKRDLIELRLPAGEDKQSGADGMAIDTLGNLYVATSLGVQIYRPSGEYIDTLAVEGSLTNLTFGGDDMKMLFITTRAALYRVHLNIEGCQFPQ